MTLENFKYLIGELSGFENRGVSYSLHLFLLAELYGSVCANHIENFILNKSDFESVEQLYDFVSDPMSKHLT